MASSGEGKEVSSPRPSPPLEEREIFLGVLSPQVALVPR